MDWIGSGLAGGVLSAAGSIFGGLFGSNSAEEEADKAYERQRELMSLQNLYNVQTMQHKHQWEVEDLKSAGINPLLSATQPTGTLSTSAAPSVAVANKAQSAAALANAFTQLGTGLLSAKAQMKNAEANANSAQANLINAQTNQDRFKFDSGEAFNLSKDIFGLEKQKAEPMIAGLKIDNAIKAVEAEYIPKLKEAELNKVQTDIAVAWLVGEAQAKHYIMTGNAALASAAAQQSMAATAARLGVSQELLNSKLGEKAIQEAKKIELDSFKISREKGYLESLDQNESYRFMKTWKYAFDDIPILGNLGDYFKGVK